MRWDLKADLFDGESTAGPVPIFFAEEPEVAMTAMTAKVARAHADIVKMAKVFCTPEGITMKEAVDVIKKPRYINMFITQYYIVKGLK